MDATERAREWITENSITNDVGQTLRSDIDSLAAMFQRVEREALDRASQHWPIGELGTLTDFRCSCGATLLGVSSEERIVAWKKHIAELEAGHGRD